MWCDGICHSGDCECSCDDCLMGKTPCCASDCVAGVVLWAVVYADLAFIRITADSRDDGELPCLVHIVL